MATDMFHLIQNLDKEAVISHDRFTTKVVFQDEHIKVVLFGFAPGQQLLEHATPMPAIIHFLRGEAKISLGQDWEEVSAGAWIHLEPTLPHSISAVTEVVMILVQLKCGKIAPTTQPVAPQ